MIKEILSQLFFHPPKINYLPSKHFYLIFPTFPFISIVGLNGPFFQQTKFKIFPELKVCTPESNWGQQIISVLSWPDFETGHKPKSNLTNERSAFVAWSNQRPRTNWSSLTLYTRTQVPPQTCVWRTSELELCLTTQHTLIFKLGKGQKMHLSWQSWDIKWRTITINPSHSPNLTHYFRSVFYGIF